MTHLAAATFFTALLLVAIVAIHMTLRLYWAQIMLALRGELGRDVSAPAPRATVRQSPVYAARPRAAA